LGAFFVDILLSLCYFLPVKNGRPIKELEMTGYEMLGLAIIIVGPLWCIAGDVQLALTVFPYETVRRFSRDEDNVYALYPCCLPRFRRKAWENALETLCHRDLAVKQDDHWTLTPAGEEMRKISEILA
jgi:hypothetical protein